VSAIRELIAPVVKGHHDEQSAFRSPYPPAISSQNALAERRHSIDASPFDGEEKAMVAELPLQTKVRDFPIVTRTLDTPAHGASVQ